MAVAERVLQLGRPLEARSDRTLIRAAQAGGSDAAAALIERYYPRVYSFVSHLTHGRANAEDLTQEVFTRALAALGRFNGQYKFEHWLLRIAKNLCIDEARRNVHRAEPTDPNELAELDGIPGADFVWESISQRMATTIVHHALAHLPDRQRAVLVLREIEGLSYADIAGIVGTNLRGVEATLRRARARFRLEIARAESIEQDRAVCRRTLRLIADEPEEAVLSLQIAGHLRRCPDCRARSRAIRSADRAFGLLPPIALLIRPSWRPQILETLTQEAMEKARSAMDALRNGPQSAMAAPFAQLTEIAATVVIAASLSVAPMVARAGRYFASAAGAPPAAAIVAEQPTAEATAESAVTAKPASRKTSTKAAATSSSPAKSSGAKSTAVLTQELTDQVGGLTGTVEELASLVTGQVGELASDVVSGEVLADPVGTVDEIVGTANQAVDTVTEVVPLPVDVPSLPSVPDISATPISRALPRRRRVGR